MNFLGIFIGIDRYHDPSIRELAGAKRDAKALWALFLDTIPSFKATLLTDEDATCFNIIQALDNSLGTATSEDVVIISFSGHGTRDHRLATFDTSKQNLPNTTISMQEIASRL